MNLDLLFAWLNDFYQHYPIFCYVAGGIVLLFCLIKPVKAIQYLFLALVLSGLLYFGYYLLDSLNVGIKAKSEGIQRSEKAID